MPASNDTLAIVLCGTHQSLCSHGRSLVMRRLLRMSIRNGVT